MGAGVTFILSDDESRSFFLEMTDTNKDRWVYLSLGVSYGKTHEELSVLQTMLRQGRPDWLLVDSYAADQDYFRALKSCLREGGAADPEAAQHVETGTDARKGRCRIACVDDLAEFDPEVDLVVNYAPDAPSLRSFYRKRKRRLLGASYAPLRAQFCGLTPQVREEVRTVLISTGGTDPLHMAEEIGALVEDLGCEPAFLAPGHGYVGKVAQLMQSCDLAISAGGTTLYELCAAGVPTLAWSMADNQEIFAGKMAAAGACCYAGDVRGEEDHRQVLLQIKEWIRIRDGGKEGKALRAQEAARMHALTDGRGAARIAGSLLH